MRKIYTGKTVEELLAKAAAEKQCDISELQYEVKEEKTGFLGLGKEVSAEVYSEEDIVEFMRSYLTTYFEGIEMESYMDITKDKEGYYHIDLDTQNNAILIGKNGQTLQALNTILRAATSGEFKKKIKVLVDINGYKEDKYRRVCSIAHRAAKSVQRTKVDVTLDPMPADERKAIHNYLANMPGVSTFSEGEGRERRLKIVYNPGKEVD